jgi:hypothetical protein
MPETCWQSFNKAGLLRPKPPAFPSDEPQPSTLSIGGACYFTIPLLSSTFLA